MRRNSDESRLCASETLKSEEENLHDLLKGVHDVRVSCGYGIKEYTKIDESVSFGSFCTLRDVISPFSIQT